MFVVVREDAEEEPSTFLLDAGIPVDVDAQRTSLEVVDREASSLGLS